MYLEREVNGMEKKQADNNVRLEKSGGNPLPEYVPPKVVTYTSEEVLERIGPAHTVVSGQGCAVGPG